MYKPDSHLLTWIVLATVEKIKTAQKVLYEDNGYFRSTYPPNQPSLREDKILIGCYRDRRTPPTKT